MTAHIAGVLGRIRGDARVTVDRALGDDARGRLATDELVVAWTAGTAHQSESRVALSGALWNAAELAAELDLPDTASHDTIVERALSQWGEGAVSRFRGGFVALAWDPATRTGVLATDHLGVGGLFLHEHDGRLSFATELRILLRLLPSRPAPSTSSVVQWLVDGYLEREQTLWDGVRRLAGGSLLRLDSGTWTETRYWSPRYSAPVPMERADARSALATALGDAVRRRLGPDGTTGILLSGGLDSSAVASVACRLPRSAGGLKAYTYVYPGRPELDESALVRLTVDALGIPWEPLPVPEVGALPAALEFQSVWGIPAPTPMLAFTQPLLEQAATDGIAVMLDGEGGDELFDYSPYLVADRLLRGRLRGALTLVRSMPDLGPDASPKDVLSVAWQSGVKGAAPHTVHGIARRLRGSRRYGPRWLASASAELYAESRDEWHWKRASGPRWWSYLAYLVTSWREQMGAHDFFRQRDALAGIETRHPLLDDVDLVETVLRVPPELAFDPALTRPLERSLIAGVVPDEIRLRREKPTFDRLFIDAIGGRDHALATLLLGRPDAELWAYARQEPIRSLLDVAPERRTSGWARLVWRLVTTESWLRSQSDEEFPLRALERAR